MKHEDKSLEDNMLNSENAKVTGPNKEPSTDALSAGESRRRFVKGTLAVAPVLMTVVSRPAWGNACAPSGMVSGNLSSPGADAVDCGANGLSPDEYVQQQSNGQWQLFVPFPSSGTKFSTIFAASKTQSTLEAVLTQTSGTNWKHSVFERAAVAAYANVELVKTTYLNQYTVQCMVNDVISGAGYQAAQGVIWYEADVLAYFMFTWGEGPLTI